jgi:hypothetical protein
MSYGREVRIPFLSIGLLAGPGKRFARRAALFFFRRITFELHRL